jgi:pyridinium-3,5-bisthiocarboxylic acid mononucleotide nickel chelatase
VSTAAWIDASAGAAGDMLLGALLDAGADLGAIESAITRLSSAAGEHVTLRRESVRRHGLRATHVVVEGTTSTMHRRLADVLALVTAARLAGPAEAFAIRVFGLLASAEARVHGVPADEIEFHEVGALDSLADVVGTAAALDSLGLLAPDAAVTVSSVGLGRGTVTGAHGLLPVPVPAVLQLLADAGAPVDAGPGAGELCTPTGAALLAAVASGWGPVPPMVVSSSGSGAGGRDPGSHANVLRVLTGTATATVAGTAGGSAPAWQTASLRLVESTVDDLDPRLWPEALAAMHTAGAIDCWLTPVLLRNGRPGHVVSALTGPDTVDPVVRAMLRETTTLGVRVLDISRLSLPRDQVEVEISGHAIPVKRGWLDGEIVTAQPEFADARAAAQALGLPLAQVLDAAREAARALAAEHR